MLGGTGNPRRSKVRSRRYTTGGAANDYPKSTMVVGACARAILGPESLYSRILVGPPHARRVSSRGRKDRMRSAVKSSFISLAAYAGLIAYGSLFPFTGWQAGSPPTFAFLTHWPPSY